MARRAPRSLVALGGSAVAAIYLAGYLATSGADASAGAAAIAAAPAASTVAPAPLVATKPTLVPIAPSTGPARGYDDGRQRRGRPGRGDEAGSGRPGPGLTLPVQPTAVAPIRSSPPPAAATPSPAAGGGAQAGSSTTASGYRDGTYTGAGTSRRGGFEVAVTIQGGRIASVALTRVTTQYPASRIAALPGQVVARQSTQVDRVSGATYSVQAFQQAVQQALARASAAA